MGSWLTRKHNPHQWNEAVPSKQSLTPSNRDNTFSNNNEISGVKFSNRINRNGNVVEAANGTAGTLEKKKESIVLPLADKRISVKEAQCLLQHSRSKALSDLTAAGSKPNLEELSACSFPFENAAFEGGGVKGIAYIGAVKCLEDAGIKLKRFSGVSIGASVAGFLSVGFTAEEMVALYLQDLSIFIRDSRCELLCFLPRLAANFGLNPGKKFFDWYGRCLAVKTQDPDITFRQVYERFGSELCVVVLNVNTGREEYCHPKTTPHLSIRKAIRMSISVPGVLEPRSMSHANGKALYVDGGLICNYPIYVFDGWWLSMDPKYNIYNTMHKLSGVNCSSKHLAMLCDTSNRFSFRNSQTIGFTQTAVGSFFNDRYASCNEAAHHDIHYSRPNTKLSRRKMKRLHFLHKASAIQSLQRGALLKLFEVLHQCSNSDGYVVRGQLIITLSKDRLTEDEISTLFGTNISLDKILDDLPAMAANKNLIGPRELDDYFKSCGLDMHRMTESTTVVCEQITNLKSFWRRLQSNVTNAARRGFIKHEDLTRTVNIHTDYVEFLDFDICTEDKVFLMQQGYKYTLAYLQSYVLEQKNKTTSTDPLTDKAEPDLADCEKKCDREKPIFYIDDDESYNNWLCGLTPDNISLTAD